MDKIDAQILNLLQKGLPLCETPYREIANQIGTDEQDVLTRIKILKDKGTIRRISGFFNPRSLGYTSTLCAVNAPQKSVESVSQVINEYLEVTHSYLRDNDQFNIWFTVIASGKEEMDRIIDEIERKIGFTVQNFPSRKFFKIKVNFEMEESK
ncbi:MAG: Transcription regulator AsnC-type [Oscillospiraceae bacterium]|jgi:DNA-binding Lrp family transcriptional regulator|nr:Transcription regulator AsnC-type [Oscillospiraceae bacterium]